LDAANAATKNMTQDVHLKIVHMTGSSTNKKQHEVGCECIHTAVNGSQITVYLSAGVRQEVCDQYIAAYNRKPLRETKTFVRIVRAIGHQDVKSLGSLVAEFCDKHPCEYISKKHFRPGRMAASE
jgi:hypothetical protein